LHRIVLHDGTNEDICIDRDLHVLPDQA
jgi:hypothetical protein